MPYCDPADLFSFGVPRGTLPNPGRLAGSVSSVTDAIELQVHGFALNDVVTFRAEAGGSLPAPLVAGTSYYAIPAGESYFKVSSSLGGDALDLTTAGSRVVVIAPLSLDSACIWASAVIDDMLPAHVVPLTAPYPPIVRITAAELAASKLGFFTGNVPKTLTQIFDYARKRLERWASGVPIKGTNAPKPAQLSCGAGLGYSDTQGWKRYGGIG
jgi:hypothetical protein